VSEEKDIMRIKAFEWLTFVYDKKIDGFNVCEDAKIREAFYAFLEGWRACGKAKEEGEL